MTEYDEYITAVTDLSKAIVEADHAAAKAQRDNSAAVEQFDRELAATIKGLQKQAVALSAQYSSTAQRLQGRRISEVGVQLPEKVRPVAGASSVERAAHKQEEAAASLKRAIADYEAAVASTSDAASEAAAALAARRAAIAKRPAEPAQEPAAEPEPPAPKQPLIGPLGGLPLMWLAIAIPCAAIGAAVLDLALGVAVGAGVAFVIAFLLVGIWRITLGSLIRTRRATPEDSTTDPGALLECATEQGVMSGYEPDGLKDVQIPSVPLMHGEPGAGLAGSGFDSGAVRAGQVGERNFAKALSKAGLLQQFATFWSIHMLAKDTYGREEADVDCAIVTGRTIWLVDVKYYSSGNVVYRAHGEQLLCYDVPTGRLIGEPRKMSKNMQMAVERFRSRYKNYGFGLQARVVFVPTNSGVGRIDGVRWPGDIPAVVLPDFITELEAEPPFTESLDSDLVRRTFQGLLKG